MNWDAIGAVGETLGAIAVIATLAYLAAQIRESRKATLADVYQSRAQSRGAAVLQVALNSPCFHKTLFKFETIRGEDGLDEALEQLSGEEKFLLGKYYTDLMIRMDNVHFQYQQGYLPEGSLESTKRGVREFFPIWMALGLERRIPNALRALFESIANGDES